MNIDEKIKSAIEQEKIVLGKKEVMKLAKNGKIKEIVCAKNCTIEAKADINATAKLSDIDVLSYSGNSIEMGALCGKPFTVVVLGITK